MANRFESLFTSIREQALNWFNTLCNDYEDVRLEKSQIFSSELYEVKYRFHK